MKQILITLTFMLCLISSCKNEDRIYCPDAMKTYQEEAVIDTLKGERIKELITGTNGLLGKDSLLLVITGDDNDIFSVINLNTDSVIAEFGAVGHSRDELTDIPHMPICYFLNEGDSVSLCVNDNGSQVINKIFDFNKSVANNKLIYKRTIEHNLKDIDKVIATFYYWLGNNRTLVYNQLSGIDKKNHYTVPPYVAMYEGRELKNKHSYYSRTIDAKNETWLAFNSIPIINTSKRKFVEMVSFYDQFTITDYEKMTSLGVVNESSCTHEDVEEIMKQYPEIEELYKNLRFYNSNICTSDKYIVLLQHVNSSFEKVIENIETPGSSFIVKVKFFDWDGNYIKSFFIKESLFNIAFDDRTNTLIAQDNNNYLYKYKVKGLK